MSIMIIFLTSLSLRISWNPGVLINKAVRDKKEINSIKYFTINNSGSPLFPGIKDANRNNETEATNNNLL